MESPNGGAVDASVAIKRSNMKNIDADQDQPNAQGTVYALVDGMPDATAGAKLKLMALLLESPVGDTVFKSLAEWQPGMKTIFNALRSETYTEEPRPTGLHSDGWGGPDLVQEEVCSSADAHSRLDAGLAAVQRGGHMAGSSKCSTASNVRPTILDYNFAYTHDMATPTVVAERVIAFLEAHNPTHNWLSAWSAEHIREAAAAATERYAAGKPLSVLDGVPFVVKDCIDALPYPTGCGTRFMGKLHPVKADAPCVAALKELGAVLLGKGAMVEFGIFAHGENAHAGGICNPHQPTRTAGGSSSGSAAAVAAGLCPIAIGTDGGGSIRVPASYCGVVGMKPTTGRLADEYGAHHSHSSLVATGPIANSMADLTLLYAVMANAKYPDMDANKPGAAALRLPGVAEAAAAAAASPPKPLGLPRVLLEVPEEASQSVDQVALTELKPLAGFRIGVFPQWCFDCSPAVAEAMKATINRLVQLGAKQVDITLPDLHLAQVSHLATWAREVLAEGESRGWLDDWSLRSQLNLDTRVFLKAAASFTAQDYEQAQRIRARVISHFKRAFEACDVILTPATPTTAPEFPAEANTTGTYDPAKTFQTVRFTVAANVTGLPAVVLPVGRQIGIGLPIGAQLMAAPFAEATLLRVAAALEQQMMEDGMPRPVPSRLVNPIQGEKGAHPLALEMTRKLWSKKYGNSAAPAH